MAVELEGVSRPLQIAPTGLREGFKPPQVILNAMIAHRVLLWNGLEFVPPRPLMWFDRGFAWIWNGEKWDIKAYVTEEIAIRH